MNNLGTYNLQSPRAAQALRSDLYVLTATPKGSTHTLLGPTRYIYLVTDNKPICLLSMTKTYNGAKCIGITLHIFL
jgi:hypothetical protein